MSVSISEKLSQALQQWRDDLIDIGARNPLLNFKQRRTSSLDLAHHSLSDLIRRVQSRKPTFIVGTKPEALNLDEDVDDLEAQVFADAEPFDFSSHPDSIFVDRTQRDVDRVVKNLASRSSRTFLDKGLNPLHISIGGLIWKDSDDEEKLAPLILIPATLARPGPRQPLALNLSSDDFVANPALAIKLEEFAIDLPSDDRIQTSFETGGATAVMELFHELKFPTGWQIVELQSLSMFTFQKEAMYRDLLANESEILSNGLIRALGGGGRELGHEFAFEPIDDSEIDEVAPPETTPLILDADSSQRAAVHAAISGKSFVLDGPPGTGKSQTIANIIGGLIANRKTVLFVSEKIVALEVVRERLEQRGLGSLILELHSSKTSRKDVAQTLGASLTSRARVQPRLREHEIEDAREKRESLNAYALAMNETRTPLDSSIFGILGKIEELGGYVATPDTDAAYADLSARTLARISDSANRLGAHWDLFLQGEDALWFGLENQNELAFKLDSLAVALEDFNANYGELHKAATNLRLDGTFDLERLTSLLEVWASGNEEYQSSEWLASVDLSDIKRGISEIQGIGKKLIEAREKFSSLTSTSWLAVPKDLELFGASELKTLEIIESRFSDFDVQDLVSFDPRLRKSLDYFEDALRVMSEICATAGLQTPNSFGELKSLVGSLRIFTSEALPPPSWYLTRSGLSRAKSAIDSLRDATENEIATSDEASIFRPEALKLDLGRIHKFFVENSRFWDRFSGEYRAQRRTLRSVSISRRWSRIFEKLPAALEWQEAHSELLSREKKHQSTLDDLYQGIGTDWIFIGTVFENAETISRGLAVEDVDQFSIALDKPSFLNLTEALIQHFDEFTNITDSALGSEGFGLSKLFQRASLTEQRQLLSSAVDAFALLHSSVTTLNLSKGGPVKVGSLVEGFESLRRYKDLLEDAADEFDRKSKKLLVSLDFPEFVAEPAEFTVRLQKRLDWTEGLLSEAGKRDSDMPPGLLTKKELKALQQIEIPADLASSARKWEQAFETFCAAFDEDRRENLLSSFGEFHAAAKEIRRLKSGLPEIDAWIEFNQARQFLESEGLTTAINAAETLSVEAQHVSGFIICALLRGWVGFQIDSDHRLANGLLSDRDELIEKFRVLDDALKDQAISEILDSAEAIRPRSFHGQAAFIQRESEKKTRHKSVKDQIAQSSDVILALHPCLMMSPLAVSQFLPSDIRFDVVIFDEASQVTPSDAINCVYRGKAMITAGDQKQLPPTKFFVSISAEDEDSEEDVASDYESILDLMKASGAFVSMTLRWHYRSRHENLIAFSNTSFYGGRLITFPGAVHESENLGVKFFHVPDGVYRRSNGRDNPNEARAVASRVIYHFQNRPDKSLGVVAFSNAQQDTIESAITLARKSHPELDHFFDDQNLDRQRNFFVSNLESVQGDERDVIIFSVGYGPDENGKIYKNFGPISRDGGERRLNVAFTRARDLVELVSSMDASQLGNLPAGPSRHLQRYLDYAQRGPAALAMDLESDKNEPESPFEESVMAEIVSWGYEVVPQVGVAGYRIDLGVRHPESPGTFMLGVECDGAMYHSSRTARDRDRLRHEVLVGLGWDIHHIWGTSWYRHRQAELAKLKGKLDSAVSRDVEGRLTKRPLQVETKPSVAFEVVPNTGSADWLSEYQSTPVEPIPREVDISDSRNSRAIVPLVKQVVKVEQPVHIEVVLQRLRTAADVGRVGNRIRETVDNAIALAGASKEGDFLYFDPKPEPQVRIPSGGFSRDAHQIPPDEMVAAIVGCTRDAIALDHKSLIDAVCRVYGWSRKGSRIQSILESAIDRAIGSGVLVVGSGGLRLP